MSDYFSLMGWCCWISSASQNIIFDANYKPIVFIIFLTLSDRGYWTKVKSWGNVLWTHSYILAFCDFKSPIFNVDPHIKWGGDYWPCTKILRTRSYFAFFCLFMKVFGVEEFYAMVSCILNPFCNGGGGIKSKKKPKYSCGSWGSPPR